MTIAEIFRRNPLHTEALYLEPAYWQACADAKRQPPFPLAQDLEGIRRLRVVLPQTAIPPRGWQLLRETVVRTVPVLAAQTFLPIVQCPVEELLSPTPSHPAWHDWITLHWQCYEKTHQDNPPRKTSFAEQEALFAGDDLQQDNGVALFQNDELFGFSSLRLTNDASPSAEFGWTGTSQNAPETSYQTLMGAVLQKAAKLGFETITFEADSTDLTAWAMVALRPSVDDRRYFTWQKQI